MGEQTVMPTTIPDIKTTESLSDLFRVLQHLSFGDWMVFLSIIIGATTVFSLVASMFPIPRRIFLRFLDHIEGLARAGEDKAVEPKRSNTGDTD